MDVDDDSDGSGDDRGGGSAHAAGLSLLTRRLVTTADEVGAGFELLEATEASAEMRARKRQRREAHAARIAKQAGRGGGAAATAAASDDELDVGDADRAALAVRGYSCALVRDDAAAAHVDAWRHLVPLGDAAAPALGAGGVGSGTGAVGGGALRWRDDDESDVIVLGRRSDGGQTAPSAAAAAASSPPPPPDGDALMVDRFDGRLLLGRSAAHVAAAAATAAGADADDAVDILSNTGDSAVDEPSDADPSELSARLQHERYRDLRVLEWRAARQVEAADGGEVASDIDYDDGDDASSTAATTADMTHLQPPPIFPALPPAAFPGPMELPFDRHPLPPALARLPPSVHPLLYRVLVTTARRVAGTLGLEAALLQRQAAKADPRFEFLGAGHPLRPLFDALRTRARRCPDDADWPEPAPASASAGSDGRGVAASAAAAGSRPSVKFALAAGAPAGSAAAGSSSTISTHGRTTGLVAYDSDDDDNDDDDSSDSEGVPPAAPLTSSAAPAAATEPSAATAAGAQSPSPQTSAAAVAPEAAAPAADEAAAQRAAELAAAKQRALEAVARLAAVKAAATKP